MSDLESVELNESSSGAPVRLPGPRRLHLHLSLALQREVAPKKPAGSAGRLILGNGTLRYNKYSDCRV
jgi:hypothetical protein